MNSILTNVFADKLESAKAESLEELKSEISADSFSAVQKILKASVKN
jgi:hypothetical protein